jgi:glutamate racemase
MDKKIRRIFLLVSLLLLMQFNSDLLCSQLDDSLLNYQINSLLSKEKVKILITDSGLGGLSVLAGIEKLISSNHSFKEAEIIFVNALPNANFRYNSMPDEKTKIKFLDQTLSGMQKWFNPDIILIACNTLSVIYPKSEFCKTASVPVVGIVNLGVNLIAARLNENNKSKVIILGTETTISSSAHKDRLIAKGINEDRIFCQPCPNLETEIQSNPQSDLVKGMIDLYADEVLSVMPNKNNDIFAALCCTHYPYVSKVFQDILSQKIGSVITILNPNAEMANIFLTIDKKNKYDSSGVSVKVYSQAILSPEEINAIADILDYTSHASASALKQYINKPDLFILH